jgi:hypothetical protein
LWLCKTFFKPSRDKELGNNKTNYDHEPNPQTSYLQSQDLNGPKTEDAFTQGSDTDIGRAPET